MPPIKAMKPLWKREPDKQDYPAAANYLSLLADAHVVDRLVKELKKAPIVTFHAKDLIRASRLTSLPMNDVHVREDILKVINGVKLSPVLLVRGAIEHDLPLTIADGYHRVCASYHLADDTDIPARIIDLPNDLHQVAKGLAEAGKRKK